jgi:hypothetical protein
MKRAEFKWTVSKIYTHAKTQAFFFIAQTKTSIACVLFACHLLVSVYNTSIFAANTRKHLSIPQRAVGEWRRCPLRASKPCAECKRAARQVQFDLQIVGDRRAKQFALAALLARPPSPKRRRAASENPHALFISSDDITLCLRCGKRHFAIQENAINIVSYILVRSKECLCYTVQNLQKHILNYIYLNTPYYIRAHTTFRLK